MSQKNTPPDPLKTAQQMARIFFATGSSPTDLRRAIRGWLISAVCSAVLVPALFWLRFGRVDGLAWGLTVFLVVYCLLVAFGLFFLNRPAYHTPIAPRGDWLDWVGAFWLMACAFGPFFGWILTSAFPLTQDNWRWLYAGRVFLSVVLPVLTALALLRYVRGRGALIMLVLLLGVTALPIWSAWAVGQDLLSEPELRPNDRGRVVMVLPHTQVELEDYIPASRP
jgi:hypothetical protein